MQAGGAVLVGTGVDAIHHHATTLLTQAEAYRAMQLTRSPFGDGRTAQRIAATLAEALPVHKGASVLPLAPPVRSMPRPAHPMTAFAAHA